jgi:hypothetical protein
MYPPEFTALHPYHVTLFSQFNKGGSKVVREMAATIGTPVYYKVTQPDSSAKLCNKTKFSAFVL